MPSPEGELFVYNWTEYIADTTIPSFEEKYGVKVTYDFFSNTDEAYAKLGNDGGGYDLSFPISVDIPAFLAKGALLPLDLSLIPNLVNLGKRVGRSGVRPGQRALGAVHVVDDRRRLRHGQDQRHPDQQQGPLGRALREAHRHARRLPGSLRHGPDPARLQRQLERSWPTGPGARAPPDAEAARSAVLDRYRRHDGSSGDDWIGQVWGADIYSIQEVNKKAVFYIPEEGGVRGSDTMAIFSGAQHPIAAHLFINHLLDAQVSAANTNFIGYMGPNAAAKEFIDPAILADPTVNPDQAIVDKLQELLDLGPDLRDQYQARWHELGRWREARPTEPDAAAPAPPDRPSVVGSPGLRCCCPGSSGWCSSSSSRWR